MIKPRCGKQRSNCNKDFTRKSLEQHQRECKRCLILLRQDALNGTYDDESEHEYSVPYGDNIESEYVINFDDEIPDGAYWALRMENPFI